ncbi:hypothetical protein [Dactylosporangium sp. NPDC051484]|uniref:hypothetical protein n=1 Tax=Dactylosporangium sp. NPDC051484 TaxID=3154942 RepID=UPI00344B15C9
MQQHPATDHLVQRRHPGTTGMTVGQLAWQLLRLIVRGGRNHRLVFVPMIADPRLRHAVQAHAGAQEWLVRSVEPQPGDVFAIAYLYLDDLP